MVKTRGFYHNSGLRPLSTLKFTPLAGWPKSVLSAIDTDKKFLRGYTAFRSGKKSLFKSLRVIISNYVRKGFGFTSGIWHRLSYQWNKIILQVQTNSSLSLPNEQAGKWPQWNRSRNVTPLMQWFSFSPFQIRHFYAIHIAQSARASHRLVR